MEVDYWKSAQSYARLTLFYPYLAQVIASVQSVVLVDPVYICVECSLVHHNQQAMAAHCKMHIRADGMAKGSVRHIRYNPDHTFSLMCHPSHDKIYQASIQRYLCPNSYASSAQLASQKGPVSADLQLNVAELNGGVLIPSTDVVPFATPSVDLELRLGPSNYY
ncbi:hypothetical protein GUJ93_ZPchr0006g41302 [Zizania palustris]|uniref:Uncharacterized protein n=1 Tax=Zizania palustris TaxID=103762 RepID=A0A8J5T1Z0_ZIZPA|nr:hypothetical protein GUJ93_ZPchr0006g41302 [Zizania palustris]